MPNSVVLFGSRVERRSRDPLDKPMDLKTNITDLCTVDIFCDVFGKITSKQANEKVAHRKSYNTRSIEVYWFLKMCNNPFSLSKYSLHPK